MLKSKVDVSEVLQALASSNSAMTADEVAKEVGVLRPFVNPMLIKMAKSGQVEQIAGGDDQPIRFKLIQGGLSDKPANEVIGSNASATVSQPKAKDDEPRRSTRTRNSSKTSTAPKKSSETKPAKANEAPKSQPELKVVPQVAENAAPAPTRPQDRTAAETHEPIFTDMEMRVLSELRTGAKTEVVMLDTLRNMRNAEQVLADLRERGIITSEFIIDERAYMLTEKAVEMLEKHDEQQASISQGIDEGANEPSSIAPVSDSSYEPGQLTLDEPEAPNAAALESRADIASASMEDAQLEHVAHLPTEPVKEAVPGLMGGSDDMMKRVSALLEDIVSERMGSIEQQTRRDSHARKLMAANINKATSALQIAIEALNEVSKQLSQD